MGKVHPGATLVPHFRDFLPAWVARQPWFRGAGIPSLRPVGYFRFEDPAGEVGIETHLVSADGTLYQLPMTYRGAPLAGADPTALIATAQHSVLGTRWIYDGPADPVWARELLRLVRTDGTSEPSGKRGVGPAGARVQRLTPTVAADEDLAIEVCRVLEPGEVATGPLTVALVVGAWSADGPDSAVLSGCLAAVTQTTGESLVTTR